MKNDPPDALLREALAQVEYLLGLTSTLRDQAVSALAGSQPALYPHVVTLLRAVDAATANNFLSEGSDSEALSALQTDAILGNYRLEAPLGQGGMGEVWKARRTDGAYDAAIALKVLHSHLSRGAARQRFIREGRILGGLSHPHIARLLDAGISGQGAPYIVLEYVEGRRIDQWCNEHSLSIADRVVLFLQVCDAVAYAHAHLIVHRDLKPSNILVSVGGEVKLLDFGVAKLVAGELLDVDSDLTRVGDRLLTPEYAAPEQFRGDVVSTATDVYSLGVVLYELLSGAKPFAARTVSQWSAAGAMPVMEHLSLGDSAARSGDELHGRAENNRDLRRQLRGDLDAIVSKAMRSTPSERYPDARAIREDLQRFLRHEPVSARATARTYLLQRYVRRHWLPATVLAVLMLTLLAGIIGVSRQAKKAREEAHTAEVVQAFLENIFHANSSNQSDPLQARATTARQLLDIGANQIESALVDTPAAKLRVLHTLVNMYDELGESDEVLKLQRRRVDLARRFLKTDDPAFAVILTELGNSAERIDLESEAEPAYLEAERILDRAQDFKSRARAELESSLAFHYDSIDPHQGKIHAEKGVRAWRSFGNSATLINALVGEANINISLGDYRQARDEAAESKDLARQLRPAANEQLFQIEESLGYAEAGLDHFPLAELYFKSALTTARGDAGDEVMEQLEVSGPLADFLLDTGRPVEAFRVLDEARRASRSLTGLRSQSMRPARTDMRYGRALLSFGRLEPGMQVLSKVDSLLTARAENPLWELTAQLLDAEAAGMMELGRYDEAAVMLDKAATLHRKTGEEMTPYGNRNVALRTHLDIVTGRLQDARRDLGGFWSGGIDAGDAGTELRPAIEYELLKAEIDLHANAFERAADSARRERGLMEANPNRTYLALWEMRANFIEGEALRLMHRPSDAWPRLLRAVQLGDTLLDTSSSVDLSLMQIASAECALALNNEPAAKPLIASAVSIQSSHPILASQFTDPLRALQGRYQQPHRR